MKIINTRTGIIYVERERMLEFLSVGDYGKEFNIKANFMGLKNKIEGVQHKQVDLSKKWVATISTQHGCFMQCNFCDVHKYGFHGNVSLDDLDFQIWTIITGEKTRETERFNVHFARMGEPTFNFNVIDFTRNRLRDLVEECGLKAKTIHPVVSTMLPKGNSKLYEFISDWVQYKEESNGEAGLQLSINSTDDKQRNHMFNCYSLSLDDISDIGKKLPNPIGRKYTLNFAVTEKTILDAVKLSKLFDNDKFIVKITPIHETNTAIDNGYDVSSSYEKYDVYESFEKPLLDIGFDVIVFVPSKEEDTDRITCGNALISDKG